MARPRPRAGVFGFVCCDGSRDGAAGNYCSRTWMIASCKLSEEQELTLIEAWTGLNKAHEHLEAYINSLEQTQKIS
jgi:hypothetical protein